MLIRRLFSAISVAITCAAASAPADASIVIGTTRVVYDAASGEKTVRLTNKAAAPVLMQAWLDTGDPQGARSALVVPFIVSPAMARIDPEKSQTLRILHTGEPLAQDRESVFWLNVLGIPPRPDANDQKNFLQLSIRSRIKLFYRPAGLAGSAMDAAAKLNWRLARSGPTALEVTNPTPFYVSFASVELVSGAQASAVDEPGMLAPFETRTMRLPRAASSSAGARVRYQFINDYGGTTSGEAALHDVPR